MKKYLIGLSLLSLFSVAAHASCEDELSKFEKAAGSYGGMWTGNELRSNLNHFPTKVIAKRINVSVDDVNKAKNDTDIARTELQDCINKL